MAGLPAIVFRCIKYLESQRAHLEEGIFRLSGSSNLIKGLKDKFNAGMFASSICIHESNADISLFRGRLRFAGK